MNCWACNESSRSAISACMTFYITEKFPISFVGEPLQACSWLLLYPRLGSHTLRGLSGNVKRVTYVDIADTNTPRHDVGNDESQQSKI